MMMIARFARAPAAAFGCVAAPAAAQSMGNRLIRSSTRAAISAALPATISAAFGTSSRIRAMVTIKGINRTR